jgi:cell division protein FtsQ
MLNRFYIRYRYKETEERRRGATPMQATTAQILQQALTQVMQKMPWTHIGLTLMVALLAGSIPWVSDKVLDAMDRQITGISVRGDLKGVGQADLEKRLQPWLGRSFFASDLETIKASVEQEPWVDTAAVRRVWPGRLVVEVVEHEPVAFWNGSSLMTRKGEIITPDSVSAAGVLPQLNGPEDRAEEVLGTARRLSDRLVADDLRLAGLSQEARGAWTLKLDNGIAVELGRDRIEERLERFLAVYRSHLKTRVSEVAGVDARYSNGIAVRWKDSAQENI